MVRILLADDQAVVRRGLRALLEARRDFELCAEASNGREAVELRPARVSSCRAAATDCLRLPVLRWDNVSKNEAVARVTILAVLIGR